MVVVIYIWIQRLDVFQCISSVKIIFIRTEEKRADFFYKQDCLENRNIKLQNERDI